MPRHRTKFAVFKKRFRLHWNEFFDANGSGGRSPGYNGNSFNVHSQNRVSNSSQMPKRKFSTKNKVAKVSKVIYVLLFLTNIIYAEFDSLRALKKEVAKDD